MKKFFDIAIFLYKVNSNISLVAFHEIFKRATHMYPIAFSKSSNLKPLIKSK